MMIVAWLGIIVILALGFNGLLEQQHNPNQDVVGRVTGEGVREVVLEQNRGGHYVATGTINGRSVDFLLDTGATQVAVPGDLAERMGLERGPRLSVQTANGVASAYRTRLESLTLGPLTFEQVPAVITPGMRGNEVLLGMNLLRSLELLQRGRELTLRQY
ncbi:MAG: TIGR02281 family clan AA aspartic protease [Gammaproteobacteria bacterium]|nr:TIGR02281 family clan AA aspartic protease [Gammaproteobacteria bacterium]